MTVVQNGVAKSGNLWLYRTIEGILQHADRQPSSWIERQPIYQEAQYWELSFRGQAGIDTIDVGPRDVHAYISSLWRDQILDMERFLEQASHVWTHSPWSPHLQEVYERCERRVYIVRDPRDIVVSMAKFEDTPYKRRLRPTQENSVSEHIERRALTATLNWVRHVGFHALHRRSSDIHVVFFENLKTDFKEEASDLATYLGVDMDADQLAGLAKRVSLEAMREQDSGHVRRGEIGQGRRQIPHEKLDGMREIAGPLMEVLGYEWEDGARRGRLSGRGLDQDSIRQAITSADQGLRIRMSLAKEWVRSGRPLRQKARQLGRYVRGPW